MAKSSKRQQRLSDGYSFAGFRAQGIVRGVFGDPDVRIVTLERRSKKPSAAAAVRSRRAGTTGVYAGFVTFRVPGFGSFWNSKYGASGAAIATP